MRATLEETLGNEGSGFMKGSEGETGQGSGIWEEARLSLKGSGGWDAN